MDEIKGLCDELGVVVAETDIVGLKRIGKKHQTQEIDGGETMVPHVLIVSLSEDEKKEL